MTGHTFEALKYALRQNKDGTVVSFVVHPNDCSSELNNLPIGARVEITWTECTDEEPASCRGMPPVSSGGARGRSTAPQSGEETAAPAPVAQLDEHRSSNAADAGSSPAGCAKPRRRFETLPLSQQCAIRCGEKQFWEYLRSLVGDEFSSSGQAAKVVRDWCTVASRSELDTNNYAARIWKDLESKFQSWLTTQAHAETYR